MNKEDLTNILGNYFSIGSNDFKFQAFGAGLIHGTYLIEIDQAKYILQEFNRKVFNYPDRIAHNQRLVKAQGDESLLPFKLPLPIMNSSDRLVTEWHERLFRLFDFVPGQTIQQITDLDQAYLAARAYGIFADWGKIVDPAKLQECIPGFHRLDLRYVTLQTVSKSKMSLANEEQKLLDFYLGQEKLILEYNDYRNCLPLRLTHNDTKINNLIFSDDLTKVEALVDLDTLMSGYLMYDFGDLVRTVACSESETSQNWNNIHLDTTVFEQLLRGYWEGISSLATEEEARSLLWGGEVMTCLMGIRFLTDHLQGNVYYKVAYPEQNFHRARNQMLLLSSIQKAKPTLETIWASNVQVED